jgi:alpha-D-ribose 1-methylphosphonate 5-triphosphate synthase subunit PhnL
MPLPYGWGTGENSITASILTQLDFLKVIDQSADDTPNAVIIRASGSGKSTLLRSMLVSKITGRKAGSSRSATKAIGWTFCRRHRRSCSTTASARSATPASSRAQPPRVSCLAVVADLLRNIAIVAPSARACVAAMLERLNMAQRHWALAPVTLSGGELQRVNIARGLIARLSCSSTRRPRRSMPRTAPQWRRRGDRGDLP